MAQQNSYLPLTLGSVTLSLSLVLSGGWPIQAQVAFESIATPPTRPSRSVLQATFEPPGDGEPNNTAGGASRAPGKCSQDAIASSPSMTPLMPATHQGITVAERPTFFVYIPQTSAKSIFFSLKDTSEDYYYQTTVPLPKTSGIVSFQLPSDAPPLEIDQSYQWSFVTICGEKLAVDDPRVQGEIKRIELDPTQISQLEALSPLERASLYGADGIWFDTLTTLAELRRSQPQDSTLTATWENFLKSVGLEAIATKPLLE